MALTSGSRLGSYEILAPLGAGGMGEVYRARDAKLGREVAVKVLPQSLASDPTALVRFEREARAVAALSHPNILAIHDLGESEGVTYAVMELLEGENLQQRLASGPLPQRKAIEIAREIALGLAAAHEKGIAHRDLKPANVFLTRDGRVKILDFGLARHLDLPSGDSTESPTVTQQTQPGTILGTVGYMAPEQLRGIPADGRSDIFSLGAVLYELLSGRRAFRGNTSIETMNAILKEDPPEIAESSRSISPALEGIVRHCLEKNPAERFQSARDVAFGLDQLSTLSAQSLAASKARVRRRVALPPAWAVAAGVALLAAGAVAGWRLTSKNKQPQAVTYKRLTFRRGNVLIGRFAPDGQTVAYAAAWDGNPAEIFTVRTDGTESRPVNLGNAEVQAVSSKGEMAVLLKKTSLWTVGAGTLARVSLSGGTPREILEDVVSADWAPNGEDLAVIRAGPDGKSQLEYPIGHVLHREPFLSSLRVSPDGDLVAFTDSPPDGKRSVRVVDRRGKQRALVTGFADVQLLVWSRRGDEVLFTGRRSGSDGGTRAFSLAGHERVLLADGGSYVLHDISPDGRLLLERAVWRGGLVCSSGRDSREREVPSLDYPFVSNISADGRLVLFGEVGEGASPSGDVFLHRTSGGQTVRLGDGRPQDLSPDGRWILSQTLGPPKELVLLPTGPGASRKISIEGIEPVRALYLANGKGFLLLSVGRERSFDTYVVGPDGGKPARVETEEMDMKLPIVAISPDCERLAYVARAGRLKTASLRGERSREIPGPPLESDEYPIQWSADGGSLYIWLAGSRPAVISRLDLATGRKEPWKEFLPQDPSGVVEIDWIALAPDGRSYAYSYSRMVSSILYVAQGLQ